MLTTAEAPKVPMVLMALLTKGEHYHWPEAVTRAWWQWALTSQDPAAQRLIAATDRIGPVLVTMQDGRAKQRQWVRYLRDYLTPAILAKGLETLVASAALDRQAANRLEDDLLTKIDKRGRWKRLQ